jgi:hypothetical protein
MADDMPEVYHNLSYKPSGYSPARHRNWVLGGPPWQECGTETISNVGSWALLMTLSSAITGAGEGNRTLMTSLEDR